MNYKDKTTTPKKYDLKPDYLIMDCTYIDAGGGCMVSINEVWLKDENRTVFVNVSDSYSTITTVNHLMSDIVIEDFDTITVDTVDYHEDDTTSYYFELHRDCLFKHLKHDCRDRKYKAHLQFCWLPECVQSVITKGQRQHIEETLGEEYMTDGYTVELQTVDSGNLQIRCDYRPTSLGQTLAAALYRCREKVLVDEESMDADDLQALQTTIQDLVYWLNETNE